MTKRFGFTLAEVLITLGIIGVVAAMTIPTLISNTNGAQFKTAYKKALSTLNQAVLMNVAMEDTDFSTLAKDTATAGSAATADSMGDLLKQRMQSATYTVYPTTLTLSLGTDENNQAKTVDLTYNFTCNAAGDKMSNGAELPAGAECDEGEGTVKVSMDTAIANYRPYSFADGTTFMYYKDANKCTDSYAVANKCYGFIDVNGTTGPNSIISCLNAADGECESSEITDIFPVIFHGQTVEPATDSARAVLFGK